ncbi:Mitochondrial transcription factor 2 [Nakaseomyces bracarensis]|uniref:Mitochondrial transcription factor 2 n=1 Tax=Nakaseomyces bracarensis TaxID=273131 RepID=A0ABR4NWC0_9SACH
MIRGSAFKSIARVRCFSSSCRLLNEKVAGEIVKEEEKSDFFDTATQVEQHLYNTILQRVQEKKQKLHQSSSVLDKIFSNENGNIDKADNPHIIFESKSKPLKKPDQNLVDYLTGKTEASANLPGMKSANLTNFPVSLRPETFMEESSNSERLLQDLQNNLKSPTLDRDLYPSKKIRLIFNKKTLEAVSIRENFKDTLNRKLGPFLKHITTTINTDYDLLIKLEELLQTYDTRDRNWDVRHEGEVKNILDHIEEACTKNPHELPQPYRVTLPHVIVKLLEEDAFGFSPSRRYAVANEIFYICKGARDITLYLNVCNVEFYNLLLQLSWENFKEIKVIRQLTSEMNINGIIGDITTIEILDGISHKLRDLNDTIPIVDEETYKIEETAAVLWNKESEIDLRNVESYLRNLKQRLTS